MPRTFRTAWILHAETREKKVTLPFTLLLAMALVFLIAVTSPQAHAQDASINAFQRATHVADQAIITVPPLYQPAIESALKRVHAEIIAIDGRSQSTLVKLPVQFLPDGIEPAIARLRSALELSMPLFRDVVSPLIQPNYIYHGASGPTNPLFSSQWGLLTIHAQAAWLRSRGRDVVVAIIDSGIALRHVDLTENIWTKYGDQYTVVRDAEPPGQIDVSAGINFSCPARVPFIDAFGGVRVECAITGDPEDNYGHGSHVAGIVAAVDNDVGVAGVSPQSKVMAIKFLDANGIGTTWGAVLSIEFAIERQAQIINASWDGFAADPKLLSALSDARANDVLVVVASGNTPGTANNDRFPIYPAGYHLDNMIVVESVQANDQLAYDTRFGHTTVDLAAPGASIVSTTERAGYEVLSGTSMAAPHVSGVAALIRSLAPRWAASRVRQYLLDSARRVDALADFSVTGAVVDADRATAAPMTFSGLDPGRTWKPGRSETLTWDRPFRSDSCLTLRMTLESFVLGRLTPVKIADLGTVQASVGKMDIQVPTDGTTRIRIRAACDGSAISSETPDIPLASLRG